MDAPQSPIDLCFASATEQLRLLEERQIGALELLDLHLARIDSVNPAINAVVTIDADGAREAARRADSANGQRGRLHGLPMTVKECYSVAGMRTTCGFPFLADYHPTDDAEAVAQLKQAGAVIFGKTNLPTGAGDHQSFNPLFGTANNPWDLSKTVGGSSGGSAAAIAAGLSALELGSDIAGSIRVPAHFCGVYGHKPTYGIVPLGGHIPPLPGEIVPIEMAVCGPLARSALDLELAMDVLVAPMASASKAWTVKVPRSRHDRVEDFRVAVWLDDYALDDRCRAELLAYIDDLQRVGATVTIGAKPDFDAWGSFETFFSTLVSIFVALGPEEAGMALKAAAHEHAATGDRYAAIIERSAQLSHRDYVARAKQRVRLMDAWARFFENYDVLLCPVSTTTAFPHDHSHAEAGLLAPVLRTISMGGTETSLADTFLWSSLAAVANLPATSMPTGRFVHGLPVGIQIIGPSFDDRTPIRFAQLVEKRLGGFVKPGAI
ncbi:amidase [Rhizobium lusitanum]|uniref:amidase n=1 Tax=Rhizobium lusitanum TaxID=293958 RepID=UPI001957A53D|nr:amidase [Rhizobium lusitanum]MBM7049189.1 amidase [Rhizobium lusitanum]